MSFRNTNELIEFYMERMRGTDEMIQSFMSLMNTQERTLLRLITQTSNETRNMNNTRREYVRSVNQENTSPYYTQHRNSTRRTTPSFISTPTFTSTNNRISRMPNIFNDWLSTNININPSLFQRNLNTEELTPVIIRPTVSQINRATRLITFSDIAQPLNQTCPISLIRFTNDSQVRQIIHCGHCFDNESISTWFQSNVRCPLCRYDIRLNTNTQNYIQVDNYNLYNNETENTETENTETENTETENAETENTETENAETENTETETQNTETQNTETQNTETQNTETENTETQNTETENNNNTNFTNNLESTVNILENVFANEINTIINTLNNSGSGEYNIESFDISYGYFQ